MKAYRPDRRFHTRGWRRGKEAAHRKAGECGAQAQHPAAKGGTAADSPPMTSARVPNSAPLLCKPRGRGDLAMLSCIILYRWAPLTCESIVDGDDGDPQPIGKLAPGP